MTKYTTRNISRFKQSKRAVFSLYAFIFLFLISLLANFIANDKPILIVFAGKSYFPLFKQYAETEFGGDFKTEADYQDPYVKDLINKEGFMLMPLVPYSYNSINYNLSSPPPTPPDRHNFLGTDDQGRDIFARLLYGLRISIIFGIFLTVISSIIGIFLGAVQGYFAGKLDLILQRIIEIWQGLPALFILIILASVVTPNFWWLLLILTIFSWTALVSPVRAEFLKGRNLEYVKAARSLGVKEYQIIFRHILPNALVATLTFLPFILSSSIISLTSLDFLGFGMPPGSPSLGELLAQGKNNPSSYWIGLTTFFTLSFLLTILIFIGEGIRDCFRSE